MAVVTTGLDDTGLADAGPDEEDAGADEPAADVAVGGVEEAVATAEAATAPLLALPDEQAVSPTHTVSAVMTTTVGRASMGTSGSHVP